MFRKFVIAAAAIAALGTVSLTASTTPAAAWHKGGGHHFHGGGFRVYTGVRVYELLPAQPLGREPLRRAGATHRQRLLLSARNGKPRPRAGETGVTISFVWKAFRRDQARSKRSRFITLVHAATKSFTNFSFESAHA